MNFENISNTELSSIIDNWVKGERNRRILKRRLIDRICYEPLAEEFELSVRHVKNIVYHNEEIIFRQLQEKQQSEMVQLELMKSKNLAGC